MRSESVMWGTLQHPARTVDQWRQMASGNGHRGSRAILDDLIAQSELWMGATRLELEVYPDNDRARTLYEGSGFVAEGARRMAVLRDGAYVDVLVMGRLRIPT